MEILGIITKILSVLASVATTFFAVYAFVSLLRQEDRIKAIFHSMRGLYAMRMGEMVEHNLDTLSEMRQSLEHLIEEEEYEAAEKMKNEIEKAEAMVEKMVDSLSEDGIVRKVTTIKKRNNEQ